MSKKMVKLLSLIIAVTMLFGVTLVGCGTKKEEVAKDTTTQAAATKEEAKKEEAKKEPVTIIYSSFRYEDEATFKKLAEKFEKENPDIKVKLDLNKDTGAYYQTLKANVVSGENLDVFDIHPSVDFTKFVAEGYMADLSNLDFVKNYTDGAKALTSVDGKIYGYNQAVNLELCIYNKEKFKKYSVDIPKDFNDLVAIVNKMKAGGEGGIAYCGGDVKAQWLRNAFMNIEGGSDNYKTFLEGVDSGAITSVKDNAAVYAAMKDLAEVYKSKILYDNSVSIKYPQSLALFAQGKAPIVYMGTWTFGTADKDYPGIDFGIFPMPTLNKAGVPYAEPAQISCVYTKSKNVEASKKWVNFMATPENAAIYISGTKMTPTVKGVKLDFKGADMLTAQIEKGVAVLPIAKQPNADTYTAAFDNMSVNILFKGADADKEIAAFDAVLKKADLKNKK